MVCKAENRFANTFVTQKGDTACGFYSVLVVLAVYGILFSRAQIFVVVCKSDDEFAFVVILRRGEQ